MSLLFIEWNADPTIITLLGFPIRWYGLCFAFAFLALRPSLRVSPIPKPGAPLITVGIYKWFRHPMYLGVLMFGVGMLITNLNLASILIFIALSINMVIKANYEDHLLRNRHSNALEYQQRVIGLLGRKNA